MPTAWLDGTVSSLSYCKSFKTCLAQYTDGTWLHASLCLMIFAFLMIASSFSSCSTLATRILTTGLHVPNSSCDAAVSIWRKLVASSVVVAALSFNRYNVKRFRSGFGPVNKAHEYLHYRIANVSIRVGDSNYILRAGNIGG